MTQCFNLDYVLVLTFKFLHCDNPNLETHNLWPKLLQCLYHCSKYPCFMYISLPPILYPVIKMVNLNFQSVMLFDSLKIYSPQFAFINLKVLLRFTGPSCPDSLTPSSINPFLSRYTEPFSDLQSNHSLPLWASTSVSSSLSCLSVTPTNLSHLNCYFFWEATFPWSSMSFSLLLLCGSIGPCGACCKTLSPLCYYNMFVYLSLPIIIST